ncbi:MAG: VIT1/CCC1 transporter family protein [Candidatus Niyogibacteria bacterium]|nr:VIT1/CCC1 transporter family protein [Candidatus Niyogibacteria bacterium]
MARPHISLKDFKRLRHTKLGFFLEDGVFGANDGIVSTFAVVASIAGASLSPVIVIIVGIANMFADAFSMATSNYLANKSSRDMYWREHSVEKLEVEDHPATEVEEIRVILARKGYEGEELEKLIGLITKNKKFWIDLMMYEELGFAPPDSKGAFKHGAATFFSFIFAGSLPLLPYFFLIGDDRAPFFWSFIATGCALFFIGALRAYFTKKSWTLSGLEMLFFGGIAALIAYGVGYMLGNIVL